MPTWSFDAIDKQFKPKTIKLECEQCGSDKEVQVRQLRTDLEMAICPQCVFEMFSCPF